MMVKQAMQSVSTKNGFFVIGQCFSAAKQSFKYWDKINYIEKNALETWYLVHVLTNLNAPRIVPITLITPLENCLNLDLLVPLSYGNGMVGLGCKSAHKIKMYQIPAWFHPNPEQTPPKLFFFFTPLY